MENRRSLPPFLRFLFLFFGLGSEEMLYVAPYQYLDRKALGARWHSTAPEELGPAACASVDMVKCRMHFDIKRLLTVVYTAVFRAFELGYNSR